MTRPIRPFAALVWKELVDLTRYSAPLLVLYAVFIWLDARPSESLWTVTHPAERFVWFGVFNSLAGVLLGFYQTWRENRSDAWAFAMHRPVSRSRIFAAKVLTGQLTLLTVAGLPYAIAMVWTAMPGHVAVPFDVRMWQPGVADLMIGLVFHAAGLLIGARHSGVLARVFVFVAAMFSAFIIGALPQFGAAILTAIIAGAILLTAGWATFVSGNETAGQHPVGRLANVLAFLPACLVLFIIASILWDGVMPDSVPAMPRSARLPAALVTPDGEIARVTVREQTRGDRDEEVVATMTDLDGRPRPDLAAKFAGLPAGAGVQVTSHLMLSKPEATIDYRNPSRSVLRLNARRRPLWYFERRHRLISVYHDSTRQRTGWIGPDGFVAGDSMPTRRFEGDVNSAAAYGGPFLVFTGAVYSTDYPAPPKLAFLAPAGDTIQDVGWPTYRALDRSYAGGPSLRMLIVTTNRAVYVVGDSGQVQLRSEHPMKPARWSSVSVWRAPNAPGHPTFLWYPPRTDTINRVLEYRDGTPTPIARYAFPGMMFEPNRSQGGARMMALSEINASVPVPITASAFGFGWELASDGERTRPSNRAIAVTLLLAATSMIAVWLIGRRYAFSARAIAPWLVLALITGPFSLLMLWLATDWPAREKCPSCGRMRVVSRERCEHCEAPFGEPEVDGTEVFGTS